MSFRVGGRRGRKQPRVILGAAWDLAVIQNAIAQMEAEEGDAAPDLDEMTLALADDPGGQRGERHD